MNPYDLVIIDPQRASFRHLLERFQDDDELVEIHIERRRGERRRDPDSVGQERRRSDRRTLDVTDSLRSAGFALIPASQRH